MAYGWSLSNFKDSFCQFYKFGLNWSRADLKMSGTGNRVSPLQVSTLESILNVLKSDNGEGNKESNKESKPTRILVSPKNDSKVLNQKFSQAQVN